MSLLPVLTTIAEAKATSKFFNENFPETSDGKKLKFLLQIFDVWDEGDKRSHFYGIMAYEPDGRVSKSHSQAGVMIFMRMLNKTHN